MSTPAESAIESTLVENRVFPPPAQFSVGAHIGGMAQDPGRIFPGKKMTGHLGDVTVTTQNLDVVRVDEARQLLLIKGAIPGAKGGFVSVRPAVKAPATKGAN